jgi:uncharacterized protein
VKPSLLIFAKAPRMGVSKTRLAHGIGVARAWRVKRTLDAFTCRVARCNRWTTRLAVSPDRDLSSRFDGAWPLDLARVRQGKGNLGDRIAAAMRNNCLAPVCIIGTDLPDLKKRDLAGAFKALKRSDVVFGPATDGGFWLIGMTARCARTAALHNVRWSSPFTLADTLATLPRHWRVTMLREMEDVDDAASFRRRLRKPKV